MRLRLNMASLTPRMVDEVIALIGLSPGEAIGLFVSLMEANADSPAISFDFDAVAEAHKLCIPVVDFGFALGALARAGYVQRVFAAEEPRA